MSDLVYLEATPAGLELAEPIMALTAHPRRRRTHRRQRHPGWVWALLLIAAAAVPVVGAWRTAPPAAAQTPSAGATATVVDDGPFDAELPMQVRVRVGTSERSGPLSALPDHSLALGTPNAGSLSGGVQLPVSGTGFYTYDPATQNGPQAPDRRWGTATLVSQIMDLGEWWRRTHPDLPPLGIGDLSRQHGGPFTGPGVGHSSHQNGLDVDVRLPRRDRVEGPANPGNYDRALTQQIVDRAVAQGAALVLIGPHLDLTGPAGVVVRWPNHDDHLHLRFPDPDGTGN